ncbi:MAG: glycosyl hydrolase family 8 [Clostridia bacterium]|nr:glycosyl hydrolase family 8 [Clostridia bacterium]
MTSIFIAMIAVIAVSFSLLHKEYQYVKIHPEVVFSSDEEKEAYDFIFRNLASESGGIYTNALHSSSVGDLPGGSEILSESVGLILQYAIESGSQTLFEKYFLYLKEVMMKKNLVIWKVDDQHKKKSGSNALIDDLRICGLLIDASKKWGEEKYLKTGMGIAKGLRRYNVKNSFPIDFYDFKSTKSGNDLAIKYLDLNTIKKISDYDDSWKVVYSVSLEVFKNASAGKNDIFFMHRFDVKKRTYVSEPKVNMIELAIILENSLKAGLKEDLTLGWIRENYFRDGFIVNEYGLDDGKAISKDESPAVYAILSRVFSLQGDHDTANKLYKRMLSMRVTDKNSKFYGGYANIKTGESFSFDNLQALITIRYKKNIDK